MYMRETDTQQVRAAPSSKNNERTRVSGELVEGGFLDCERID